MTLTINFSLSIGADEPATRTGVPAEHPTTVQADAKDKPEARPVFRQLRWPWAEDYEGDEEQV